MQNCHTATRHEELEIWAVICIKLEKLCASVVVGSHGRKIGS